MQCVFVSHLILHLTLISDKAIGRRALVKTTHIATAQRQVIVTFENTCS